MLSLDGIPLNETDRGFDINDSDINDSNVDDQPRCKNCVYCDIEGYIKLGGKYSENRGLCRRHAPVTNGVPRRTQIGTVLDFKIFKKLILFIADVTSLATSWASVNINDDWCGEFEPKIEEDPYFLDPTEGD